MSLVRIGAISRLAGTLGNLRFISSLLFERSRPLWQQSVLAFPVALVPSAALLSCVYFLLTALGVNTAGLNAPSRQPTWVEFVGAILFSPLVETLFLAGLLRMLSWLSPNKPFIAAISGLIWGALHAIGGVLWFFGTVWSFFVFSCLYLSWRGVSVRHAYMAALIPHMLINLAAMSLVLIEAPNPSIERTSSNKIAPDQKNRAVTAIAETAGCASRRNPAAMQSTCAHPAAAPLTAARAPARIRTRFRSRSFLRASDQRVPNNSHYTQVTQAS